MWRRKGNSSGPDQASTSVIDKGCELEGRFTFAGKLILNGKLQGTINSPGTLLVGETGQVQADVHVGTAIISGEITGNIIAQDRVEILGSGRVIGDIVTPVLVLEEGVVFDGHCKMNGEELRAVQKSS